MTNRPPLSTAPARKALGQHFLFDPDILRRTALAAGPVEGRTVIEVGPGPGGLTRALLDQNVETLICVEADPRFAQALKEWPEHQAGRLHLHEGDARKVDWQSVISKAGGTQPAMIVANLPYNVGTPLLIDWLKASDWRGPMALMFQKEVAQRACAKPGDPHYGRLGVLTAAVADAHIAFTLPPGAFRPPPKVDSAVAVFHPLPEDQTYPHVAALEAVTMAAFGQRRKMLRAALKSLAKTIKMSPNEWLNTCDVDPTARAETLTQSEFRRLADLYENAKKSAC
ncbi:MAG: 16S rRNA (adenine(1518)-N(6)/adenine(1519)-N(6))-dimethyltransferase RsmA [Pseudomonadota bacterium]